MPYEENRKFSKNGIMDFFNKMFAETDVHNNPKAWSLKVDKKNEI
jgi:hypothetical protein